MPNLAPLSFACSFLAGLMLTLNSAAVGQAVPTPESRVLEPGRSVERELAGGQEHRYRIVLQTGQHARVQLSKQGVDVSLTWHSPTGAKLAKIDLEALEQGSETFSLVAQSDGPHTLLVEVDSKQAPQGRYQIMVDELRAASEQDQRRYAALRLFAEAYELLALGTVEGQQEASQKLTTSLTVWQSVGDQVWEARTFFWLGWTKLNARQYGEALDFLNQALALRRATHDRSNEAEVLRTIGMIYEFRAENQPAIDYFNQALALQQGLGERWQLAATLLELGKVYWQLGEQEKARFSFAEAQRGFREIGDEENYSGTLTSLGYVYITQGNYQAALDNLQRALPYWRAKKTRDGEAVTLSHLGLAYYNLGEPQKALTNFRQSLAFFRRSQNRYLEAYALLNIGVALRHQGDKQPAIMHFKQALRLMQAIPDPRGEANVRRHLGQVYQEIGNLPQAVENLHESLRLAREQGNPMNEAAALTSLGEIYAARGEVQKGMESLTLALSLHRKTGTRPGEAQTLSALAEMERNRGAFGPAQKYAEAAIEVIESVRSNVAGAELRTAFLATNQGYYERYIELLMQMHQQAPAAGHDALALQVSERARARALLDLLAEAHADIRQGIDAALLEREQMLQKQLREKEYRHRQLLSRKPTPEQIATAVRDVETTLAEYQEVQANIRVLSPRYAALTQPQPLGLTAMQAQLDDDTLLLVYSLGTQHSFLWAVTPTTVKSYLLPAREKIKPLAERVHQALQKSHQRASGAAAELVTHQLSRLLLEPLTGQLAPKRLVIVADDVLQYIPFATLFAPASKERLTEKHEIVHLPSVSALHQLRQDFATRASAPLTMAMIADPVFEMADKRFLTTDKRPAAPASSPTRSLTTVTRAAEGIGRTGFTRLLYSEQEAEQITRLIPDAQRTKLVGFDASRAKLDATDLSQYRMLHFATHSVLHPKTPELSGIVLSLYDRARQPQNGFLPAHEIYNLKLNAELVVLSACETALGKEVRGEGLIGLSRGFLYAGTPRLVVSLWKVNDQATAELMQRFYHAMLRDNLRPAAALRAAQSSMAQEARWAAPYYWAGFVLQGEWR